MRRCESKYIPAKAGHTLHVHVLGEGAPVLCLSGFASDDYNFELIKGELARDYKLILLSNRGMGKSSKVEDEYEMSDLASDAFEVMDQLGIDKFSIVAISMGGFIAQLMGTMKPERVLSLTMLCTSGAGKDFLPILEMTEESLIDFYRLDPNVAMKKAVELTTYPDFQKRYPDRLKEIIDIRVNHPVSCDQVILQKRAVDHFLASEIDYTTLSMPIYIMAANEDRVVPIKNAITLHNKIPYSNLECIQQSDHLFFMERPSLVSGLIKKHLGENI